LTAQPERTPDGHQQSLRTAPGHRGRCRYGNRIAASAHFFDARPYRLRLVAYNCAASLLFRFVGTGLGYAVFVGGGRAHPSQFTTLVWIGVAAYLVCSALFLIKRAHDMDWSGWTALIGLIPLVGLIFVFKRGSPGPNRYGLPPPPNTLGVKILAMVFPFVVVLGIAAAIAIPAYQGYKARAAAAAPH
jgi:uncharacterized membrane protein YhaH (DUF805 family)